MFRANKPLFSLSVRTWTVDSSAYVDLSRRVGECQKVPGFAAVRQWETPHSTE